METQLQVIKDQQYVAGQDQRSGRQLCGQPAQADQELVKNGGCPAGGYQIGWWWPGWKEGLSRDDIANDPGNIKAGYAWNNNWIPEGYDESLGPLTLAWFADTRKQVASGPAYDYNPLFQLGVERPGGSINDGDVTEFQVTLNLGFRYEE